MGKNGSFDYALNAQICVDADLQIIMAQYLSQNDNDKQEVEPAPQSLQKTTDRLPEKLSADNGYWSGDNLQALEQSGQDAYLATDKGEKNHKVPLDSSDRKLVKADIDYQETDNTFTCLEEQLLIMKRETINCAVSA